MLEKIEKIVNKYASYDLDKGELVITEDDFKLLSKHLKALFVLNGVGVQSEQLSCNCPICNKEMTSQVVKHHHCKECKEHFTTT